MDVRCSRCGTDYEFDDTLISERGTTVKCTNCSYQFKIFPPKTSASAPERWLVRTATGKEIVFTSLRELQRGIADRRVGPNDLLSRGRQPPRALGSIAELEPFFASATGPARGLKTAPSTLHGVAPPPSGAPRPESAEQPAARVAGTPDVSKPDPSPAVTQPQPFAKSEPGMSTTLPISNPVPPSGYSQRANVPMILGGVAPTEPQRAVPPPKPTADAPKLATTQRLGSPSTTPTGPTPVMPGKTAPLGTGSLLPDAPAPTEPASAPAPPPARVAAPPEPTKTTPSAAAALDANFAVSSPRAARVASVPMGPTPPPPPISTRERLPSYDETSQFDAEPGRRARTRWIAGIVFIGVAGLLGLTVGRQYAARFTAAPTPEGSARDERASRFLGEGTNLTDQGDYEGAQESLLKAQALADRDPAVLTALARLETLRADQTWLKLRLLDPTATELVQATHRELGRRVGRAQKAVDAAFAVAPEDPAVTRARVDAMRLAGDEKKAREWIAPVSANASDPQNAYVLAALDLADAAPAWATVIDRLRTAAVSERETARARAALVYALVRAGRVAEAETELAKIAHATRPHPLIEELTAFVDRFKTAGDAGVDAPEEDAAATLDPKQLPALDTSPAAASEEQRAPGAERLPPGDFRTRLTQAARANAAGDLENAQRLYQSVLTEQPGNTEAMSGLADVARKRGDRATAQRLYAKVLEANPSYLPALTASADGKWESGDRAGAVVLYRRIVEQAGTATDYGQRAQARIAQAEREGKAGADAGSAAASSDAATESGTAP